MRESKFLSELTFKNLLAYALPLIIYSAIHVAVVRFISARALEQNDTDLFGGIVLLLVVTALIGATYNAIQRIRAAFAWRSALALVIMLLNFLFFFWMLIYHIPSPGSL